MLAYSLLRDSPWYRRQAFEQGLQRAGFDVLRQQPARGRPGDVLLIWNRYGWWHDAATKFEKEGGTVVVAENGYLGKGGTAPKYDVHPGGPQPDHYYSVSVGFHNGRGSWPQGGAERFAALEVELKSWRTDGDHILICPNRSFGVGAQVMNERWADECAWRVSRMTSRPIRIRRHPGNDEPKNAPLAKDFEGARAVFVWSSSCAVHSLLAGIPTFIEAPWQIVKRASASGDVEAPQLSERLPHFERMAWSQWRLEEIESGEPFSRLLSAAGQAEVARHS